MKPKLEQKWWKDHKAKTLKSTGFGEAIKAYTDLKAKLAKGGLYDRCYKVFADADKALKNVEATRKKAHGMCGKLHDDTKKALEAYEGIIKAEAAVLSSLKKDYDKFVNDWSAEKRNGFREMPQRDTDWKEMKKKVATTIKNADAAIQSKDPKAIAASLGLVELYKEEVEALMEKTIESCNLFRKKETTVVPPAGDDQPDDLAVLLDKWANFMKDDAAPTKNACLESLEKAKKRLELGVTSKDVKKAGDALKNLK